MAEIGQGKEPIRITPVSESLYSRTPERGGYIEIYERVGVDQYGHEWRSYHRRFASDSEGLEPSSQLADYDDQQAGE